MILRGMTSQTLADHILEETLIKWTWQMDVNYLPTRQRLEREDRKYLWELNPYLLLVIASALATELP